MGLKRSLGMQVAGCQTLPKIHSVWTLNKLFSKTFRRFASAFSFLASWSCSWTSCGAKLKSQLKTKMHFSYSVHICQPVIWWVPVPGPPHEPLGLGGENRLILSLYPTVNRRNLWNRTTPGSKSLNETCGTLLDIQCCSSLAYGDARSSLHVFSRSETPLQCAVAPPHRWFDPSLESWEVSCGNQLITI